MDYDDLDKEVQEKIKNFHNSVEKLEKFLEGALNPEAYDNLSTQEKVDYDLFITYTLNTLYWMYLRCKGQDPTKNEVANQLARLKDYMRQAKQAKDRNTIRPTINQAVAERFIKHGTGIYNRDDSTASEPQNKKIRFDD